MHRVIEKPERESGGHGRPNSHGSEDEERDEKEKEKEKKKGRTHHRILAV